MYVQDDWRATNKLTLNLGLRWDVYPPWIEVDDRQSNFDETNGTFVLASDDATIGGVRRRAGVCRPTRRATSARGSGFAYDLGGDGKTIVRGGFGVFWNFTPGRHVVVEGAEPAVPPGAGAHADAGVVDRCRRCSSRTACRRRPAWIRIARRPGTRGRSST